MSASALLARGWLRGNKTSWFGTAAVLAVALAVMVIVAGLFAGMQAAVEERVADVYTAELRVTPREPGILGAGLFEDAPGAMAALGTAASPRMESQMILSRRGFLETLFNEDDQVIVQGTGGDAAGSDSVSIGVLVGAPFTDPAVARSYRQHLVAGSLPGAWTPEEPVPLVLSLRALEGFLTAAERDALPQWPPAIDDLRGLRFELTAAKVTDEEGARDFIRLSGRVVGLYATGVNTLDELTAWAPIGAARVLVGHDAEAPVANALHVHGDAGVARDRAAANGWASEDATALTARYLGQLIGAMRTLAFMSTALLFTVPAFLLAHDLDRILAQHRREVAVLGAIGVGSRSVRGALGALVAMTCALGLAVALPLAALGAWAALALADATAALPVPMGFQVGVPVVLAAVVMTAVAGGLGFLAAARAHGRIDLADVLRAP